MWLQKTEAKPASTADESATSSCDLSEACNHLAGRYSPAAQAELVNDCIAAKLDALSIDTCSVLSAVVTVQVSLILHDCLRRLNLRLPRHTMLAYLANR